jgi:cytochrome b
VTLSRRWSAFLLAVALWSWIIWPTFLRNIWKDDRSFDHGPTGFLLVHAVLVVISLVIGTAVGVLGWQGWRAAAGRSPAGRGHDSQSAERVPEPAP